MNEEEIGKDMEGKHLWPILKVHHNTCLVGVRETAKPSVVTIYVSSKIQTGHLTDTLTGQKYYHLSPLAQWECVNCQE